jgi:hypothetical protein
MHESMIIKDLLVDASISMEPILEEIIIDNNNINTRGCIQLCWFYVTNPRYFRWLLYVLYKQMFLADN